MLAVSHLTCQRGERVLFQDLSFDLPDRQWLQIAGTNGAGKTSLLRILAGLSEPATGSVAWNGVPVRANRSAYHADLLYLGHQGALKEELTPLENLTLGLGMEGFATTAPAVRDALTRFGLSGRERLPVRYLSAGQRRRVLLCRLRLRPARLWILDEPYTALDVHAAAVLTEHLESHLAQGGSVLLTSHQSLSLAPGMCITL